MPNSLNKFWLLLAAATLLCIPAVHADIEKARKAYAEMDYAAAFTEYSIDAEKGVAEAQAKLGVMYFWGRGTNRNDYEAFRWSLLAAKQGEPTAQQMMGYLYENGIYVQQDLRRARDWYQQASELGNASATASLASYYIYGMGIPKDISYGMSLAMKAAEKDDPIGQYLVGLVYKEERQDYLQAKKWFTKSAEQANAEAANQMGAIYFMGLGEAQNLEQAYFWFLIAEEFNSVEGQNNRIKLQQKLTYESIKRVQERAGKWLEKFKPKETDPLLQV